MGAIFGYLYRMMSHKSIRSVYVFQTKMEMSMVKKLEWIEMAQLAVYSILFQSLSLKLPKHLQSSFHDSVKAIRMGPK